MGIVFCVTIYCHYMIQLRHTLANLRQTYEAPVIILLQSALLGRSCLFLCHPPQKQGLSCHFYPIYSSISLQFPHFHVYPASARPSARSQKRSRGSARAPPGSSGHSALSPYSSGPRWVFMTRRTSSWACTKALTIWGSKWVPEPSLMMAMAFSKGKPSL